MSGEKKMKFPALVVMLLMVSFAFGGATALITYATGKEVAYTPKMLMVSHTEYRFSEPGQIIARLVDFQGNPVTVQNCTATILYPDKTKFVDTQLMTPSGNISGDYYYSFTTPAGPEGVYEYQATCTYASGTKTASVTNSFHLSSAFSSVFGNLTAIDNTLVTVQNNLTQIQTDISNLNGDLISINQSLSVAIGDLNTTVVGEFNTIQQNFTEVLNQISNLNGSLGGDITNIFNNLTEINNNVNTVNNNVDDLSSQLADSLACIGPERTPTMTGYTTPAPYVVTASNDVNSAAWHAFDSNHANTLGAAWKTSVATAWLKIDMGEEVRINKYLMNKSGNTGGSTGVPTVWELKASNDDVNYVVIDSYDDQCALPGCTGMFYTYTKEFTDTHQYRYWMLNVTANNDGNGQQGTMAVLELELYEEIGLCQLMEDAIDLINVTFNDMNTSLTTLLANQDLILGNLTFITNQNVQILGNISVVQSDLNQFRTDFDNNMTFQNAMLTVINDTTTNTYEYVTGTLTVNIDSILTTLGVINATVNRIETNTEQINSTVTTILDNQENEVIMTVFSG